MRLILNGGPGFGGWLRFRLSQKNERLSELYEYPAIIAGLKEINLEGSV
jgi:hypothetical protein